MNQFEQAEREVRDIRANLKSRMPSLCKDALIHAERINTALHEAEIRLEILSKFPDADSRGGDK